MHEYDPTGSKSRQQESYRTILFAIGTVCTLMFILGACMVAQTPVKVDLGRKIVTKPLPKPVPVKLGQPTK
jgi:hypothetical protein